MRRSPSARGRSRFTTRLLALAALLLVASCDGDPEPALPLRDLNPLGGSLAATFDDPLLLTVAAARPRTRYLVDQGYGLARESDGTLKFATDTAGELGLAFRVDGKLLVGERDYATPATIRHTASDALVLELSPAQGLRVEVRFVTATSRVALLSVELANERQSAVEVELIPWLRHCAALYNEVEALDGRGVALSHVEAPDPLERLFGAGTFTERWRGAFAFDGAAETASRATCGSGLAQDLASIFAAPAPLATPARLVALRRRVTLPAGARTSLRVYRAAVAEAEKSTLGAELETASRLELAPLLTDGQNRLAKLPPLAGLTREEQHVYRSSFVLLDQLLMPAEGRLKHDYFLFAREPTFWFARLGVHIHEGLSLLPLARLDPRAAAEVLRNFVDRVEADGYLPYNFGPVAEQTRLRTATAPLLAYVGHEVVARTKDLELARQLYETGAKLHRFYVAQRDVDQDGLSEWGGFGKTESLRDLANAIWEEVAPPEEVEGLDLNVELVMEEKSLASLARLLGRSADAADWDRQADERARRINATLWDDERKFYFHVARKDNTFGYAKPGDLRRFEIAGLLPLWAGIVPEGRKEALLAHLTDPRKFWRRYGVPGLAADDPYFAAASSACCLWNGPVWVPWQLLLARGLRGAGKPELARQLTRRTYDAVAAQLRRHHQFREHYNPDDQDAPNRSMANYIWSAMVAELLLDEGGSVAQTGP
ncbi:MAG: hypothetical protein IT371_09050 [Deltaproteobacteria bacterium]|nr:hypothetical protein [Deltaproteobacteria bacterium]